MVKKDSCDYGSNNLNNNLSRDSFYKFSIIVAVYNTEDYLTDCIESVLNQTIGFKENVQLILVNDGSTDFSLSICLKYQELYPDNIIVLSKENGGQASARNLGLNYAKGEYLNFLDSDDKFELNVLEEVLKFFNKHDDIDLVSIPVLFFEAANFGHPLNYKYKKQRVVDLVKEPEYPQLFINSTFIKSKVFDYQFDSRLVNSEDALIVNKILLKNQKYGLVNKTKYLYRKRRNESSTIDNSKKKKGFFNDRLKYFFKELIEYSLQYTSKFSNNFSNDLSENYSNGEINEGYVPKFIQYMIAYDLQWIVSVEDLNILDDKEQEEFWILLNHVLSYIDKDMIVDNLSIRDVYKRFLLAIKYADFSNGLDGFLVEKSINLNLNSNVCDCSKEYYLYCDGKFNINNYNLCYENKVIDNISFHNLWIDQIGIKNGYLYVLGFYSGSIHDKYISVDVMKISNNHSEIIKTKRVKYPSRQIAKTLGINWNFYSNFEVKIPINGNDKFKIKFRVNCTVEDKLSNITTKSFIMPLDFASSAKLSKFSNYHIVDSKMIIVKYDTIYIENYSYLKMIKNELKVLWKIFNDKGNYYTSAIVFRFVYLILYKLISHEIWIFMDRRVAADDNAESLFKYAISMNNDCENVISGEGNIIQSGENVVLDGGNIIQSGENVTQKGEIKDDIKKVFTVNVNSKDYNRLSKIIPTFGNLSIFNNADELVPFYSIKHRLLFLFADKVISSHPDLDIINPFSGKNIRYYSGLFNYDTYFLQHGVTKDNISKWLRKYDKDLSLILTVSDREAKSFLDEGYHYDKEIIKTLGFPRFDYLKDTSRDYSVDGSLGDCLNCEITSKNCSKSKKILFMPSWRNYLLNEDDLRDSEYYCRINNLINNEKFIKFAKEKGYEIIFKPHPKLVRFINSFDTENVTLDMDTTYRELFNKSNILITDYSSVAFDFSYLKKPVLYYQYGNDYHFYLENSYFDYESMGFGKVINNEDDLVDALCEYLDNDCEMEDKYKSRVDSFYKFNDKNNSKRVYEWIRDN